MTASATSDFLQRVKSSYTSGSSLLATQALSPQVPTSIQVSSSITDQLSVLDQVLSEVEAKVPVVESVATETIDEPITTTFPAQAVPLAMSQMPDPLNPPQQAITGSAKERFEVGVVPDTASIDVGGGVQVLETERPQELPVEVEGFLQHVEDNQAQLPTEVVIATDMLEPYLPPKPLTPVVVLPITQEIEAVGSAKNPHWSVRWLVEWSRKLMKVFNGSVIYAESENR